MAFSWKRRRKLAPATPLPAVEEAPLTLPPPAVVLGVRGKNNALLPKDTLSLKIFVALHRADSPPEIYKRVVSLLRERDSLEERLSALTSRIEHLTSDAATQQEKFEELRFEKQMSELEEPDLDFEEAQPDNIDSHEHLAAHRSRLAASVALLIQLEVSRAQAHGELSALLTALLEIISTEVAGDRLASVEELVRSRQEELAAVENQATSDGEALVGDSPEDLEDFMQAMEEARGAFARAASDSAFTIDR